jgi:hypothetical protein
MKDVNYFIAFEIVSKHIPCLFDYSIRKINRVNKLTKLIKIWG